MKPGKLDLPTIWRGCDWGPVLLKWKDQNGAPMDLSGWEASANSTNINLRASIIDTEQGQTIMQLTNVDTANIGLGVEQWDWIWARPGDQYRYPPFLYGKVVIKDPVTMSNGEISPPGPPPPPPGPPPGIPPAPVAVPATNVTNTSFSANWHAAEGATSYRLDVATDNAFTNFVAGYQDLDVGNVLTWSVTGLQTRVAYWYRVRARNTGGTSPNSNSIGVLTIPQPVPPPNPPPLNDNFADQIQLTGSGSILGTCFYATRESGEPPGENSVWYRWNPQVTATLTLNAPLLNRISVYTGDSVSNLFHIASSVPGQLPFPTVTWTPDPSVTNYRIRIYKDVRAATFTLEYTTIE